MQVEWEKSSIQELDITATDLSTECLIDMLTRIPSLRFLSAGQINGFNDSVIYIDLNLLNYFSSQYKCFSALMAKHLEYKL